MKNEKKKRVLERKDVWRKEKKERKKERKGEWRTKNARKVGGGKRGKGKDERELTNERENSFDEK